MNRPKFEAEGLAIQCSVCGERYEASDDITEARLAAAIRHGIDTDDWSGLVCYDCHRAPVTMPRICIRPKCRECGRVFDLLNDRDAQEWAYGHDCEES